MKKAILYSVTGCLVMLLAFTSAYVIGWQIRDDDYTVKFSTKGASGTLKGLKGTIDFDKDDLATVRFDVTVDVNTINTGLGLKNRHAMAEDFLDAERYPTIRFASTDIKPSANGFVANGQLTIKDVSKAVTIPFRFEEVGAEAVFRGNFTLNRKDYNLEKKRVGETIDVELVVPVTKR